jgi:uncharacterized membrane protein
VPSFGGVHSSFFGTRWRRRRTAVSPSGIFAGHQKSWKEKVTQPANAYALASLGAIFLFLLVIAGAVSVYASDITFRGKTLYLRLLSEGGVVEESTAILLGVAGLFALSAFFRVPQALRWSRPFLVLFALFAVLMGLEEISWGQRVLQIEPGEFFRQYSSQKEINVHNVVAPYLRRSGYAVRTTSQIAAIVLLAYGVVLPILSAFRSPRVLFRKFGLIIPPPALMVGFFLGSLLAWFDWPTGEDEEIGEFLFSLCFVMLVPLWRLQQRHEAYAASSESSEPSRAPASNEAF